MKWFRENMRSSMISRSVEDKNVTQARLHGSNSRLWGAALLPG